MDVSRRSVLAGMGVVSASALAGCGSRSPRRTSIAIFITNESPSERRVTLRLYRLPAGRAGNESEATPATADLEHVFVHREVVATGDDVAIPGEGVPAGDLRVELTTAEGPTGQYEWDRLDERSTLDVRIRAGSVRFTEID